MPGHWMKGQKSHGDKRDNYKSGGSSAFSRTKRKKINYNANEFSGTGKNVDTSKFRDQRYEQFFNAAEIPKLPGLTRMVTPLLEKGARENRRFFADQNYKTSILKIDKPSVLEAGKYRPLKVVTSLEDRKSPA